MKKEHLKVFGTTVVGERGQIVIPLKARQEFKVNKGDQFLVIAMGHGQDAIGLLPLSALGDFAEHFRGFADMLDKQAKKHK